MTFDILHKDTHCNCIESAEENLEPFFARKIYKPFIREYDFRIKKDQDIVSCKKICALKGISINIWNEKSRDAVVRKYKTTGRFSPKNKDSICVFKFNKNAGLTRYTPSNTDDFHYDFYKSDQFDLEMIIVEEVMILKN